MYFNGACLRTQCERTEHTLSSPTHETIEVDSLSMGPAEKCLSDSRFDSGPHASSSSRQKRFTVGGLVFDAHGNHFANELEGRDYVIGEMWKSKPLFCLAVNKVTSDEIAWHCKHWTWSDDVHESAAALALDIGVLVWKFEESIEADCQASLKTAQNPNGEPFQRITAVSHRTKPLARLAQ